MRRSIIAVLLMLGVFLPATITHADPIVGGCQIFPANNPWNLDISGVAVNHVWDTYIAGIGNTRFHPDFGTDFGIPYTTVTSAQPKVPMIWGPLGYPDESDPGPYPFPTTTPIEAGSDAHSIVIETTNCVLYETFHSHYIGGASHAWGADSGAIYNLDSNALRPDGFTSADAAGLPIFPGLVRCDEAITGTITHALRLTLNNTGSPYIYPATHDTGGGSSYPPMGTRFRLKASVNLSSYTGQALVVAQALKTYGMILADNGSDWYVSGAPSPNCWVNEDLDQLKNLRGHDFEAIISPAAPGVTLPTPTLYSPTDAAQLSAAPVLDWNTVTGAERYEVVLDQNPSPTTHAAYVDATDITEYKPTTPIISGFTYYWAVRVVDAGNNPVTGWSWSTPRSFAIASAPGAAPVRNFDTTGTPIFTWNRVIGAIYYHFEVSGNLAFSGTLLDDQFLTGDRLSSNPTPPLQNGTYYWRVQACTSSVITSCGAWSVTESVLVNR